jgi:hypothetical protein
MNDGIIIKNLKERLINSDVPEDGIEKMEETGRALLNELEKPGNTSGLLYGRVQSGKTNNMIMSIAVLIESGAFKFFIVLTSDNVSLFDQTLSRIILSLKNVNVIGYRDIINGNVSADTVKSRIEHNGTVIVCTKNSSNLRKLNAFLNDISEATGTAVIFDDEADFGSLNSKQNQDEESAVYSLIERLQSSFHAPKFVEVTATPQANLLQEPEDPRHPRFIIQIEPEDGYVGGSMLYDLTNQEIVDMHQRYIPDEEIKAMLDDDNADIEPPESIYRALCTFFIGGALKNLESPAQNNFSMLVHISAKKSVNSRLYKLVYSAKEKISKFIFDGLQDEKINSMLHDAYNNDISKTLEGTPASFEEALNVVKMNIDQAAIEKIISGRGSHDPNYQFFYNILIGGNRLSRGLTVKNLTVFYYARQSGAPKMDTILQHSRVYGYRKDILDIIRIFSTTDIFDALFEVYQSDEEEWNYIKNKEYIETPPVLLSLSSHRSMSPTRSDVVPKNSTIKYFPGGTYFMYDAKGSNLEKIDAILSGISELRRDPVEVDKDTALKAVELVDTSRPNQRWSRDAVKNALINMYGKYGKIYMVVRRDSDLMKNYRAVLSESDNEITRSDGPILFMYRTSGKGNGWNGEQAWIPVLRMPKNASAYYFAEHARAGGSVDDY